MKRPAILLAFAAGLLTFSHPALAADWMGIVQAGAAYPAPSFPSHVFGWLDRDGAQRLWGAAFDYELTNSWRLGIDASGVEVPYTGPVGLRNRFRIVTAGLRGTYARPGRRFTPFGRIGMGGGVVREELETEHCTGEYLQCYVDFSYQQTNAFSGEIALGLDSRITTLAPTLHLLLSGEYHYLAAAMRPGVSSLQYFGISLGLALASRGAP